MAILDTSGHIHQSAVVRTLANGMTVCMERLPYLHSASIGLWIKTGSANESQEESGLAHFLEHLFFKGTESRNAHDIMEAIEGKGGHLNAFTSRGYTCLYVRVLDQYVHTGIEILADLIKRPTFVDWEKEKGVVLEEIATIEDTPDEYVFDLLSAFHWPEHSLGRSISGTQESVGGLTIGHVRAFFERWYTPENMVLSMAGNFDEDAAFAQVQHEFDALPSTPPPPPCSRPAFQSGIQIHDREIGQAHVALAFPAPELGNDERYVCDIASSILGGGSTSRLFERIREDEGLAYAIQTFNSFYPMTGVLGVYAAVAPGNYGKALELSFEEMRRMCEEPVPKDELTSNREQIKGNLLMSLESTFSRMSRMAKCLMYYGRLMPVDEVIENVDRVQAAEIQAFCQRTLTRENTALVVLGKTGGYQLDAVPL